MKRFQPFYRRVLAVGASAVIGLLGAVVLAPSPASATPGYGHDYWQDHWNRKVEVRGSAECEPATGDWIVKWTVKNKSPQFPAEVTDVTATPERTIDLETGTTIGSGQSVTVTEKVPAGTADRVTLDVRLTWTWTGWGGGAHSGSGSGSDTVKFKGKCKKDTSKPSVEFSDNCYGEVTVTLSNNKDARKDAEFVVEGYHDNLVVVAKGQSTVITGLSGTVTVSEVTTKEQWTYTWTDAPECHPATYDYSATCDGLIFYFTNPAEGEEATVSLIVNGELTESQPLPKGTENLEWPVAAGEGGLTVAVVINGEAGEDIVWQNPGGCELPDGLVAPTCDGLVFYFVNPDDGSEVQIDLIPSAGEPIEITLAPGLETDEILVPAGDDGLTVVVKINGEQVEEIVWERPEDCDEDETPPSPPPASEPPVSESPAPGEGGGLPVTGNATTIVAGAALAMLALGSGLFVLARRRRITFTV